MRVRSGQRKTREKKNENENKKEVPKTLKGRKA